MSIIYKALQKTQYNISNHHDAIIVSTKVKIFKYIIIISLTALITISISYIKNNFNRIENISFFQSKSAPISKSTILPEIDYHGELTLTGIFSSDQEKIAIIKNQQLHVGDIVDGMKLVSIDQESVKLKGDSAIYIIHLPL